VISVSVNLQELKSNSNCLDE